MISTMLFYYFLSKDKVDEAFSYSSLVVPELVLTFLVLIWLVEKG
jgi:hypothetical protein